LRFTYLIFSPHSLLFDLADSIIRVSKKPK